MKKNIILIGIILIVIISVSGCINNSINDINNKMKNLNTDITEGDTDYNSAINSINLKDLNSANSNIETARDKFSDAEEQLSEIEKNKNKLNESVYQDYLELIKNEVSLKKQASEKLSLSMEYYIINDTNSGNTYANSANSLMKEAVVIQEKRNQIVKENPKLFKKAGII